MAGSYSVIDLVKITLYTWYLYISGLISLECGVYV